MTTHSTPSSLNLPADKTMLDAVMFAASLASKSSDIDPQLDRVRAITAQRSPDQLTTEDKHTLSEVYDYLENYLIKKESLRSFTRDSIREQLRGYIEGRNRPSLGIPLTIIWTVAIISTLSPLLLPETAMSATVKAAFSVTIFFVTLYLGAVWMFWTGLTNFKDEIRRAYLPVCLGIALTGLSLLLIPIAVAIGRDTSVLFQYVISGLSIPAAEALLYTGMRRFAKIGGVSSRLLSATMVTAACTVTAIIVALLPLPTTSAPDWALKISLVILTTGGVLSVIIGWITIQVRHSLSAAYKKPMMWFMISQLMTTYSCIQYALLQLTATVEHPFDPRGLALIPLVLSGLVILKAGTSFRQIGTTVVSR